MKDNNDNKKPQNIEYHYSKNLEQSLFKTFALTSEYVCYWF